MTLPLQDQQLQGLPLVMEEVRELLQMKRRLQETGGGEFADQIALSSIEAREMLLLEEITRLESAALAPQIPRSRAYALLQSAGVVVSALILIGAIVASRVWPQSGTSPLIVALLAAAYFGGLMVPMLPRLFEIRKTRVKQQ